MSNPIASAAGLIVVGLLAAPVAATAGPVGIVTVPQADTGIETVQYGYGGYGRGYGRGYGYGGGYRPRYYGGPRFGYGGPRRFGYGRGYGRGYGYGRRDFF